jgi:CTP:molybdopterin cytidylyltransferase MocA
MAHSMSDQPTLIILATPHAPQLGALVDVGDVRPALPDFQHIAQALDVALDAGMQVVLLASRWVKQQCEVFAPEVHCVETEVLSPPLGPGVDWAKAVAQGVQASPQAQGWLVMPSPMWRLQPATLRALSQAVMNQPMVCPSYQMQAGYPLGFSSEFYSELVRLQSASELRRLHSRYPLVQLNVDDPGVLAGAPWGVQAAVAAPGLAGLGRAADKR